MEQEQERGITITSAATHLLLEKTTASNIIDHARPCRLHH